MDEMTGLVFSKPHLVINASQTATYECRAHNTHVGGNTTVTHTATIYILGQYYFLILGNRHHHLHNSSVLLRYTVLGNIDTMICILGYLLGQHYFLILGDRCYYIHARSVLFV